MNPGSSIYISGHLGLVGSALWRTLQSAGFNNLIGLSKSQMDLLSQAAVDSFFSKNRPEYVFLAAARVGGIRANNDFPAEFIYENLQMEVNLTHSAWKHGAKKLLFLGSSCIYPSTCWDPITEEQFMSGGLEPTNQWYSIAKIAGIKMCHAYRRQYGFDAIAVMPTNLYGPNDHYDLGTRSHVLPALIRRFHDAKIQGLQEVECWGSGRVRREFLHVDDLARACIMLMQSYSDESIINIGSSQDLRISELADLVARIVGYTGEIKWNPKFPEGTLRKLIDSRRIGQLGWSPRIDLKSGIEDAYRDFLCRYHDSNIPGQPSHQSALDGQAIEKPTATTAQPQIA